MLTEFFKYPSRIRELLSRPGGHLLESFAQELSQSGYANSSGCDHIRAAEHFLYWTHQEGIPAADLNEMVLDRFVAHLGECQCQGVSGLRRVAMLRGVRVFLAHQRDGAPKRTDFSATPLVQGSVLFSEFCQWMRQQRGTSDPTLYNYGISLRSLLDLVDDDSGKLDAQGLRLFIWRCPERS